MHTLSTRCQPRDIAAASRCILSSLPSAPRPFALDDTLGIFFRSRYWNSLGRGRTTSLSLSLAPRKNEASLPLSHCCTLPKARIPGGQSQGPTCGSSPLAATCAARRPLSVPGGDPAGGDPRCGLMSVTATHEESTIGKTHTGLRLVACVVRAVPHFCTRQPAGPPSAVLCQCVSLLITGVLVCCESSGRL